MTALDLFTALAELVPRGIEREFGPYHGCILATRIAVEVAGHFGIEARPLSVRAVLYNTAYDRHVRAGDDLNDAPRWVDEDGSYSVGIGWGANPGKWSGHLIAVAGDVFGDFSISQAEKPMLGIITGPGLVGPYRGDPRWMAINQDFGTVVEYKAFENWTYLQAPDWRDPGRRRRIAGPIIRELKGTL